MGSIGSMCTMDLLWAPMDSTMWLLQTVPSDNYEQHHTELWHRVGYKHGQAKSLNIHHCCKPWALSRLELGDYGQISCTCAWLHIHPQFCTAQASCTWIRKVAWLYISRLGISQRISTNSLRKDPKHKEREGHRNKDEWYWWWKLSVQTCLKGTRKGLLLVEHSGTDWDSVLLLQCWGTIVPTLESHHLHNSESVSMASGMGVVSDVAGRLSVEVPRTSGW